jgi:RHS repeat-associated protein
MYTVADWLSHTSTFAYDPNGNLTTQTVPSTPNVVDSLGYDAADQLGSISDTASGSTLFSATYNRDANGQLASDSSVPSSTGAYKYNPLNQLCYSGSANTNACSSPPSGASPYGFDAADNLTTNNGTAQQYDNGNQLCWTINGSSANACGTPPTGATTYTYNTAGERTAMTPPAGNPGIAYAYDQAHRLTAVNGAGYRSAVLASNPVGYWRLGETSGTTAADSSGAARAGTFTGGYTQGVTSALLTDTANKAATFNGTTGYVNGGDLSAGESTTFSVEAWVKTSTTVASYVVGEGSTTSGNPFNGLHVDVSGHAQFTVRDNAAAAVAVTGAKVINNNAWHHLVGVRNGNLLSLYVDGDPDGTATGTLGTITLNTSSVGALKRTGVLYYLNGSVDEAAYYRSALSAGRVMNHLRAGNSNFAGTVTSNSPSAYWRLAETSGTTAVDASANTHTGTYTGGYTLNVTGALTGDTNKAVTFNGTTGYVNAVPDTGVGEDSAFSAEAWIKTTTTANQYVLAEGNTTAQTWYDGLHVNGGKAVFTVTGATANVGVTGTTTVNNNVWHHLVGVRNGNTLLIYVDGELDGTTTGTPGTVTLNTTTIGALKRPSVTSFFNGSVDEAAYYPTVLDADTIARHYHNGTNASPTVASYTDNGDGLRTSKTVDGIRTNYTWDNSQGLPLLATDGTNQYIYGPGGQPIEHINGTTATYYHQDQQGSTRALTNQTSSVIATYSTDAYGNPTSSSGTAQTPLRYDGEYRDNETGYIYLRARYYDPTTASFLTRDPLDAITRSAYGYVAGNPLNADDPTGMNWLSDRASDIGGGIVNGAKDVGGFVAEHRHAIIDVAATVGTAVAVGALCSTGVGCVVGVALGASALGFGAHVGTDALIKDGNGISWQDAGGRSLISAGMGATCAFTFGQGCASATLGRSGTRAGLSGFARWTTRTAMAQAAGRGMAAGIWGAVWLTGALGKDALADDC